eukprot:TRINITY_DN8383_c0_g1_i13.p1 TRINITY_DN8383_c0_g1~~TRINITY_DN8383_c0_g1_i13.p1  ORF type:complete len:521 (+),score=88.72 TRINITY_DN8383_c0_g1_i13:262-1824(+)
MNNTTETNVLDFLDDDSKTMVTQFLAFSSVEDHKIAFAYLQHSNWNLERALDRYLEYAHSAKHDDILKQAFEARTAPSNSRGQLNFASPSPPPRQSQPIEGASQQQLFHRYKYLYEQQLEAEQRRSALGGVFNKVGGLFSSIKKKVRNFVPPQIREVNETILFNEFLKSSNIPPPLIKFSSDSIDQVLDEAKSRLHIVMVLIVDPTVRNEFVENKLLQNNDIADYLSKYAIVTACLSNYALTPTLEKLSKPNDAPCVLFLRKNILEETVCVEKIMLAPFAEKDNGCEEILRDMRNAVAKFFQGVADEEYIRKEVEKKVKQEQENYRRSLLAFNPFAIYDDDRFMPVQALPQVQTTPLSPSQSTRIQEDRELRRQQEEDYKAAQLASQEMERRKLAEKQRVEEEERMRQQEEEEEAKIASERDYQRKIKSDNLPSEPDLNDENTRTCIFRLPNGSRLVRNFSCTTTIEKLHDFVEVTKPEFGAFDIVQTYPFVVLSEKTKTIAEVIEDDGTKQVMLAVREV